MIRTELIEALVEFAGDSNTASSAFRQKTGRIHQSGASRAKFKFGGKSYSTKTKGGNTTVSRSHLGGLVKRKVASLS